MKRRPTPTSDDNYYPSDDNYGGGKITAKGKGKSPQSISKNENKKKYNNKKQRVQL